MQPGLALPLGGALAYSYKDLPAGRVTLNRGAAILGKDCQHTEAATASGLLEVLNP